MKPFNATWQQGRTSRQAHRDLPAGTFERELGREGFNGPSARLYHRRPPTSWVSVDGPLRPRAFDLNNASASEDPWQGSTILKNAYVQIAIWTMSESMQSLCRDADGDLTIFVHEGHGDLFCDFGHMQVHTGDYIVVPRGTMWRIESSGEVRTLLIEAVGAQIQLPDRGLLGPHAIFDPANLDTPAMNDRFADQQQDDSSWVVKVKKHGEVTSLTYPYNPLDAVGWTGDLAPVRINVRDLLPINSHRYHLPPSVHATFASDRFLISTFVPRPFESDETAIKIPFFHNNEDYDEVLFYHDGDFFSRDHIDAGMMTFHPGGITHGPHPGALARMFEQPDTHTNEVAVMVDARDPLEVCAPEYEIEGYATSWVGAEKK